MPADLTLLRDLILEYAAIRTASTDAATNISWIQQNIFLKSGEDALDGGAQGTTTTMEGSSFSVLWNGASSLERASAALLAINKLRASLGTPVDASQLGSGVNFGCRPVLA